MVETVLMFTGSAKALRSIENFLMLFSNVSRTSNSPTRMGFSIKTHNFTLEYRRFCEISLEYCVKIDGFAYFNDYCFEWEINNGQILYEKTSSLDFVTN